MAIFKTNNTTYNISAVYEDVRPSGNRMYFYGQAHKKSTLQAVMNGMIVHSTTTAIGTYNVPTYAYDPSNLRWTGLLLLGGELVHCSHIINNTNNDRRNNIDFSMFTSMDPNNPCRQHRYVADAAGNNAIFTQTHYNQVPNPNPSPVYQVRYNVVGELDFVPCTKFTSIAYYHSWAIYWRQSTSTLIQLFNNYGSSTDTNWPNHLCPGEITNILTGTSTVTYAAPTSYQNVMFQFVGPAADGRAIFLNNSLSNDFTQLLMLYDDTTNTITTLATFNSNVATTGGTNIGGTRGTAYGNTLTKFSSKTFEDPTSAGNRAWYTPFVDSAGNFHPYYFQWNRTTDTFTRNSDITVNWASGTNQSTNWLPDTVSAASVSTTYMVQRFWYNETFVLAGDRYLMLIQCHGGGGIYDAEPRYRTFVTFAIDSVNPKQLTYHSRVIIPETPKNIIWLNDARTLLGVFAYNNFYMYAFTAVNGWSQTVNLPFRFEAVGRDLTGRMWAVDGGPYNYGRIHLITPTTPTTVSLSMAQASYNYTGTVINTTGTLNAYDQSGIRIAAPITLKVEGSSMRLVVNGLELLESTFTTSAATDTTVNIRVVSAGQSNITASVNF